MSQSDNRRLPVVIGPAAGARAERPHAEQDPRPQARRASRAELRADATLLAAQLEGQRDRRRGLRGGDLFLQYARGSYLATQWSPPHDRRIPVGFARQVAV
jgi:hypothetical protein